MKKIVVAVIAVCGALVAAAGEDSKSDAYESACKQISSAISKPAVMASVMGSLSKGDQVKYVAAVNGAISKMSGSVEQRTAAFLAANEAALKAAAEKGNLVPVLSEVFATVPPNSLTVLSERFADTLFNRALNSSATYTDTQVAKSSGKVLEAIHARTVSADATDTRDALAIAMLVRSSNGTPIELPELLIGSVATDQNRSQLTDMVKSAVAGNYDSVVASSGDDVQLPDRSRVIRMRDPQLLDALTADLSSKEFEVQGILAEPLTEQLFVIDDMTAIEKSDTSDTSRPTSDNKDIPFSPQPYSGQSM